MAQAAAQAAEARYRAWEDEVYALAYEAHNPETHALVWRLYAGNGIWIEVQDVSYPRTPFFRAQRSRLFSCSADLSTRPPPRSLADCC